MLSEFLWRKNVYEMSKFHCFILFCSFFLLDQVAKVSKTELYKSEEEGREKKRKKKAGKG